LALEALKEVFDGRRASLEGIRVAVSGRLRQSDQFFPPFGLGAGLRGSGIRQRKVFKRPYQRQSSIARQGSASGAAPVSQTLAREGTALHCFFGYFL